jgi:hypothetical protein
MPVATGSTIEPRPAPREDPMSAASRTIQAAPGTRQVGTPLFALVLLVALGAVLVYGALAVAKPQAPAAGAAPVAHDNGWSATSGSAAGTAAAIDAGRHRPAAGGRPSTVNAFTGFTTAGAAGIVVNGANGGGIVYTGIPYPAPADGATAGSNGNAGSTRVRFAR